MSFTSAPHPMRRSRTALLFISLVVAWACGEGLGPDSGTVPLDIAPSFQVLPGTSTSPPIDRVVLEVTNAATSEVVATADQTVDPEADSWSVPISIDLGEEDSISVLVQILLYSGSTVAWSGLEGPILVGAGQTQARSVEVYRGPLDNLDVTSVTIVDPPTVLTVGESVSLDAALALVPGSDASPEIYWGSTDETVATVTETGSTVTLTAVGAGTADIIAAAGAASDEFTVQIAEGVPPGFDTQWEGSTTDWFTAGNWSGGQVPLATDNVYIPVSALDPILSGGAEVADLTIAPGASVELIDALFTVSGDLDAGTTITGGGSVELTGSGTTLRGAIETQLIVTGTVSTSGSVTVANAMYVDGSLDVGADSFSVGDVFVSGALTVGAGGTLGSSGMLTLNNGSTLNVDGTVTATNGCKDNGATITGSGSQPCDGGSGAPATRTWLGGDAAGVDAWGNANNWNPPGVPGTADTVLVPAGVSYYPVLSSDATIASITLEPPVTVNIGGGDLTVTGDVQTAIGGGFTNGYLIVAGAGNVLQGTFDNLDINVDRALTGQTLVLGDLTMFDARLDAAGQSVSVSGNLNVNGAGGGLTMTTPTNNAVTVQGNAYFNGGDHSGFLTEGILQVGGDFTATDASNGSFVATGNHELYLFGGTAQNIQFQVPGPAAQRANNVILGTIGGAILQSDATFGGNVTLSGSTSVPSAYTLDVLGDLTMQNGSVLYLDGIINLTGTCTDNGATIVGAGTPPCGTVTPADRVWIGGDVSAPDDWDTAANWLPAGVPAATDAVLVPLATYSPVLAQNTTVAALTVATSGFIDENGFTLTVNGDAVGDGTISNGLTIIAAPASLSGYFENLQIDADVTLSGLTYAFGNFDVRAPLTVGANSAYAALDLIVQGNGVITLDQPSSQLLVDGNATFDGSSSTGLLTDGLAAFYGDFTVLSTNSADAYHSTGTVTYFVGSVDQTISFDNPSPNSQAFADFYVLQGGQGAALVFDSDVFATGLVSVGNAILRQGGASTFEVSGELSMDVVTFDGLPLRLDSPVAASTHTVDNLTFTGFQGDETQLYVSLPGADVNAQLLLNSPVFETVPTTGYYLETVNRSGVGGQILAVELVSPTPVGPPNYVLEGTNTVILWP